MTDNAAIGGGYTLERFAKHGWPQDMAGILAFIGPLTEKYGLPKVGSSRYPDDFMPLPGQPWPGHRWYLEFPGGQIISVVVSTDDGRVIERSYTDRGDTHFSDVKKLLSGWQKAVTQAQRGGRPAGVTASNHKRYLNLARRYYAAESQHLQRYSMQDYADDCGKGYRVIHHAVTYAAENGVNDRNWDDKSA